MSSFNSSPAYNKRIYGLCHSITDYQIVNEIGKGTYGFVYKGRRKTDGKIFALKKIKLYNEGQTGFPITSIREIQMLTMINHENIVKLEDIVVGKDRDSVYMVMEYCEQDIDYLLKNQNRPWSLSEVKCLIRQLLAAVAYLHERWIIHRDLKTSNLLYTNKGQLKVADFGLVRMMGYPLRRVTTNVVTLWYRPPELLLGSQLYSFALDIWSVGCILGELLLRKPLLCGNNENDQLLKIFNLLGCPSVEDWPELESLPNYSVVERYDTVFVHDRLHETFPSLSQEGIDLMKKLLEYDPSKRITAEQALKHPWFSERPYPQDCRLMPTFPPRKVTSSSSRFFVFLMKYVVLFRFVNYHFLNDMTNANGGKSDICVGIDFGTHSICISMTNCNIPENALSGMQTVMNCFQKDRRINPIMGISRDQIMGCDKGYFNYLRNPRGYVTNVKQYLKRYSSYKRNPYDFSISSEVVPDEKGNCSFKITTEDNSSSFLSCDIVLVTIFKELYSLIKRTDNSYTGTNTVISIPLTWGDHELTVVNRALSIAGFHNIRFIYDIEAIALQYGYYPAIHHQLESCRVMFVDVGYSHGTVFEVSYKDGEPFNVLYCTNSTSCGGKFIDECFVQYLFERLKNDYGIEEADILKDPRDPTAIHLACEKSKSLFSTEGLHSATVSMSLQCYDGQEIFIDVPSKDFNEICSQSKFYETIIMMCRDCLAECDGADYILFEGSSSRFYEISKRISQMISQSSYKVMPKLRYTCNNEEDVSRGCCTYSCMIGGFIEKIDVILPERVNSFTTTVLKTIEVKADKDEQETVIIKRNLNRLIMKEKEVEFIREKREKIESIVSECSTLLEKGNYPQSVKIDMKDYLSAIRMAISISRGTTQLRKYEYLLRKAEKLLDLLKTMEGNCKLEYIDLISDDN